MFDRYTRLYCMGYLISIIMFMVLSIFLSKMFNIAVPPGASIATIVGGAVFASSKYAHEVGHVPVNSVSWTYAWRWSFLSILIAGALLSGLFFAIPGVASVILSNILVFLVLLFVIFLVCMVLLRATFPYFVQTQLK